MCVKAVHVYAFIRVVYLEYVCIYVDVHICIGSEEEREEGKYM